MLLKSFIPSPLKFIWQKNEFTLKLNAEAVAFETLTLISSSSTSSSFLE